MYHKNTGAYLGKFIPDKTTESTDTHSSADKVSAESSTPPSRNSDKEESVSRVGKTWLIPGIYEYHVVCDLYRPELSALSFNFRFEDQILEFNFKYQKDQKKFASFVVHNNIYYVREFIEEYKIKLRYGSVDEIEGIVNDIIEPKLSGILINQPIALNDTRKLATKLALTSKWADIDLSKPDLQWKTKVLAYKNAAGSDPAKKLMVEDWIKRSEAHVDYVNSPARLYPDSRRDVSTHNKKVGL